MKIDTRYNLITILGPTASGKTSFAARLAYEIDSEIISADSRQVYKGMDIGTGKDLDDYIVNNKKIPFHLIDITNPGDKYNVYRFQKDFFSVFDQISNKNKIPVMCGGTGLYIEAILKKYELPDVPENKNLRKKLENKTLEELSQIALSYRNFHNKIDTKQRAIRFIEIEEYRKNNPDKYPDYPKINSLNIGVRYDRQTERKRITQRLHQRLNNGMIDEVKKLIENGVNYDTLIYYGLEYKFIALFLRGDLDYETMVEKLNTAIHQFAKRQMTWFRRMQRNGIKIHWIDGYTPTEDKIKIVLNLLKK